MKPPRFTRDEEAELHARMHQGDMEAKDLLARSVFGWAVKCTLKYGRWKVDREEADGLAGIAIARTLNKFDPSIARLSTLLPFYVRREVQMYRNYMFGAVHVPMHAEHTESCKVFAERGRKRPASLSAVHAGNRDSVGQQIESDSDELWKVSEAIKEIQYEHETYENALLRLDSDRLRTVLMRRGDGDTLEIIGNELGITRERVRQLESAAIKQMRRLMGLAS